MSTQFMLQSGIRFLPEEEWLHQAKLCPVGQVRRVHHGAETSPAMVVRNDQDAWSAYCHRCGKGGRKKKELVRMVQPQPMRQQKPQGDPGPLISLDLVFSGCVIAPPGLVQTCVEHWQAKGMSRDVVEAGNPHYSAQDHRIVYLLPEGMLGRSLWAESKSKWMSYNKHMRFASGSNVPLRGQRIALTEDWYSARKISHYTDWVGVAMLGTHLSPELTAELCAAAEVALCTDGDLAGDAGAVKAHRTLELLGVPTKFAQPKGCDPKDLTPEELCHLLA